MANHEQLQPQQLESQGQTQPETSNNGLDQALANMAMLLGLEEEEQTKGACNQELRAQVEAVLNTDA